MRRHMAVPGSTFRVPGSCSWFEWANSGTWNTEPANSELGNPEPGTRNSEPRDAAHV